MICKFCGGRGCLACAGERRRLEKEAEKPLFVAKTAADLELLKRAIGREALEKAFTPNPDLLGLVGGVKQINFNLAIASLLQHLRKGEVRDASQAGDGSGGITQ